MRAPGIQGDSERCEVAVTVAKAILVAIRKGRANSSVPLISSTAWPRLTGHNYSCGEVLHAPTSKSGDVWTDRAVLELGV